jgi:hypothetical protein
VTSQAIRRARIAAKTPAAGAALTRARVISWDAVSGYAISLGGAAVTSFDVLDLSTVPVPGDIVAVLRYKTKILVLGIVEAASDEEVASFPGNSVTTSTIATLASDTIPAGAPAGSVWELEGWGNGVQAVANRQTLLLGVALGGQDMTQLTFGTTAFSTADTAWRWWARARVVCHTAGASGTWTSFIQASVSDFSGPISPGNANMAYGTSSENTGTTTQDTTASAVLALRAKWGATTGSPAITNQVTLPVKRIV